MFALKLDIVIRAQRDWHFNFGSGSGSGLGKNFRGSAGIGIRIWNSFEIFWDFTCFLQKPYILHICHHELCTCQLVLKWCFDTLHFSFDYICRKVTLWTFFVFDFPCCRGKANTGWGGTDVTKIRIYSLWRPNYSLVSFGLQKKLCQNKGNLERIRYPESRNFSFRPFVGIRDFKIPRDLYLARRYNLCFIHIRIIYTCNRVRDRYEDEVAHTLAQSPLSSRCGRQLCKEHKRSNMWNQRELIKNTYSTTAYAGPTARKDLPRFIVYHSDVMWPYYTHLIHIRIIRIIYASSLVNMFCFLYKENNALALSSSITPSAVAVSQLV
jgi:hypothetical protein